MLTAEMKHYLAQTSACLRIGGKCLITFFLLNDESRRLIRKGLSALTFQFSRAGCKVNDDLVREYAEQEKVEPSAVSLPHSIAQNAIEWGTLELYRTPPTVGLCGPSAQKG